MEFTKFAKHKNDFFYVKVLITKENKIFQY